jgi:hypothetical protein
MALCTRCFRIFSAVRLNSKFGRKQKLEIKHLREEIALVCSGTWQRLLGNTMVELVHSASNMNGRGRYTHAGQALVYSPGLLHLSTDNLPSNTAPHQTTPDVEECGF